MSPYEARVASDRLVATSCEPVPGGVRLRTPDLPEVRDYNAMILAPGAAFAVPGDVERVIAFGRTQAPPGWSALPLGVMAFDGPRPPAPAGVREVSAGELAAAREIVWRSHGVDGPVLAQLMEMQARQAAAGRLFSVYGAGRPLGWAQAIAGVVDDVWVHPAARRRGVGRDLSLAAMAAGGRVLTVEPGNAPAVGLYRSLGFAPAGTVLHLTRG